MAAVTKTTKKATVKAVASKAKAAPTGLQLSAAQWKAYNKAYSATKSAADSRIALTAAAQRFRKYRLQAANATIAKAAGTYKSAQAASVAYQATRRSWVQARLGHQQTNLVNRIYNDMDTHANILGRFQFIQSGEKAYVNKAVMRTVDTAQATSYEQVLFKAASRAATKAVTSAKSYKGSISNQQKAQIAGAATKAGLAAASKIKTPKAAVGRTASLPSSIKPPWNYDKWIGLEYTPACVPVAIANHLLFRTGVEMDGAFLMRFIEKCGEAPTIEHGLRTLKEISRGVQDNKYIICLYERVPVRFAKSTGLVVGFESSYGPHAALSLGYGRVISWGAEIPDDAEMEEAWMIDWLTEVKF
jgi:hypothetical protein